MASIVSSAAAVASVNRASPAQASMVAPYTGLKSTAGFPVTRKNNDITTLASNGSRVRCMKLPMFGCTDPAQVAAEIEEAKKEYPNAFIRVIGFDNVRQVQCISFIVYKPASY
ncbi:Ribulose bisphosphate carboxylase small chain 1, chloroplastic [Cucurbita argyrosperma subsp. argyrosperma]|nr:Ribulose bisphosphate carboxylase small chain 1, chloroplastic [Cucurbita argyrosperma subsp. argyrosperma]